jgi:hypothetical protein
MDSKETQVTLNISFLLRFLLFAFLLFLLFLAIAPYYIQAKLFLIKPLVALFTTGRAPYVHALPAYRGISLSFVFYFSLVFSSLSKNTFSSFFKEKYWVVLIHIAVIYLFEIFSAVFEILATGFFSYYFTTVLLSVGSLFIAILLWLFLFPSVQNYIPSSKL